MHLLLSTPITSTECHPNKRNKGKKKTNPSSWTRTTVLCRRAGLVPGESMICSASGLAADSLDNPPHDATSSPRCIDEAGEGGRETRYIYCAAYDPIICHQKRTREETWL